MLSDFLFDHDNRLVYELVRLEHVRGNMWCGHYKIRRGSWGAANDEWLEVYGEHPYTRSPMVIFAELHKGRGTR